MISSAGLVLVLLGYFSLVTFLNATAQSRSEQFANISTQVDKLPAAQWANRKKAMSEKTMGF